MAQGSGGHCARTGACVAERELPDYAIDGVRTGQDAADRLIWRAGFGLADADVQVDASLDDGVNFKAARGFDAQVEPSSAEDILKTVLQGARLVACAGFDVYLDDDRLIYVKEGCGGDDLEAPVFLHVFPVDPADLPNHRRQYGFDNLAFDFNRHGLRLDELCSAMRGLPDYPVARILTGQGCLWTSEFRFD